MMYMHYCKDCQRLHMLNGHRVTCPACKHPIAELKISYTEYVNMDTDARTILLNQCRDEITLKKITAVYRLHKYSKWYKDTNENK